MTNRVEATDRTLVLEARSPEAKQWVLTQPDPDQRTERAAQMTAGGDGPFSHLWLFKAPRPERDDRVTEIHPGVVCYGPESEVGQWAAREFRRLLRDGDGDGWTREPAP